MMTNNSESIVLYDPLNAPLELPVQRLTLHCLTEQPLYFPAREGSTPGTTLFGAFGAALWRSACARHQHGYTRCGGSPPQCAAPFACPVPWLYKPYSVVQRRNLTRPVLLAAPALEWHRPVTEFTLHVTLWGRQAIRQRDTVLAALQTMAHYGLGPAHQRVPFVATDIDVDTAISLGERMATRNSGRCCRALITFETPFLHRETVPLANGHDARLFLAGGELPLSKLLGNVAYELAAWDMEDRELGNSLDQRQRHELAQQARHIAEAATMGISLKETMLAPTRIGSRLAKTNGRFYFLGGFVGEVELTGNLDPALPWLVALSLGSGGQKRAMGFGRIGLQLRTTAEGMD